VSDGLKCPFNNELVEQLKKLTESYKGAVAAAESYNSIALAEHGQILAALTLADRLRNVINSYLEGWEAGCPCFLYSCGWEYCRRNLEILDALEDLPQFPLPGQKLNDD